MRCTREGGARGEVSFFPREHGPGRPVAGPGGSMPSKGQARIEFMNAWENTRGERERPGAGPQHERHGSGAGSRLPACQPARLTTTFYGSVGCARREE